MPYEPPTEPPKIVPNEATDKVTSLTIALAREAIGPLARAGQPVPSELSGHVFTLWRVVEQWIRLDDEANMTPSQFEEKYREGIAAQIVADKTSAQLALEAEDRNLDRLLWGARETIEMFDLVVKRNGGFAPSSEALQKLLGEIDAYRARHGFRADGFG